MKKILIFLGCSAAIIGAILSASEWSKLALAPIVIAFICGLILVISDKNKKKTKAIQYIFILVIMSLGLTIYKGVMDSNDIKEPSEIELIKDKTIENP